MCWNFKSIIILKQREIGQNLIVYKWQKMISADDRPIIELMCHIQTNHRLTFIVASFEVVQNSFPLWEKLTCKTSSSWSVKVSLKWTGVWKSNRLYSDCQLSFDGANFLLFTPNLDDINDFHRLSSAATLLQSCTINTNWNVYFEKKKI